MELWRVVRTLEETVANPILRRLLRSRAHWPISRFVCLLAYEGRSSGARFTTPVGYSRSGDIVHVVTIREHANWWKNFTEPYDCTLYLEGEPVAATGEVVTNTMKHESHVLDFLRPVPALAGPDGAGGVDDIDFTSYVLVEFDLSPGTSTATSRSTEIPVESGETS